MGVCSVTMKAVFLLSLLAASTLAAPESRMACSECVREMRHLGGLVKEGAHEIHDYLVRNYCPSVHDEEFCVDQLSKYYIGMLYAVATHYFVDGAVHICQTMGTCDVREYT